MIAIAAYTAFLLFCSIASYEDWRERKIRNELIFQGLLGCGFVLAYLVLSTAIGSRGARFMDLGEFYYPWSLYPQIAAHMALTLAAAVAFWRMAIWPAGDAKFFTVASLFIVLIDPNRPGFPRLLFLVFLINIFVPSGLVFAAETIATVLARVPALWALDWPRELHAFADRTRVRWVDARPYRWQYAALTVNMIILFIAIRLAQPFLGRLAPGPLGQLAIFFALLFFWGRVTALLRRQAVGAAALILISVALCFASFGLGWDIWAAVRSGLRMAVNFGLFISLARIVLYWWIERESLREADAGTLAPGDILSDNAWEALKRDKTIGESLGKRYCDGLTTQEAGALKAWLAGEAGGRPKDAPAVKTEVYRTIPFGVWIFLGALLTLTCRTTVVPLLLGWVPWGAALLPMGGYAR